MNPPSPSTAQHVTFASGITIQGSGTLGANIANQAWINSGIIDANQAGQSIQFLSVFWTNNGTVEAQNGGFIDFASNVSLTNYSAGTATLTGGTWEALAGSSLRLEGKPISVNAAAIILGGSGSAITTDNAGATSALTGFNNNAAAGSFTIQSGRTFTTGSDFTNAGALNIASGSVFTTTGDFTQSGGTTTVNGALNSNTSTITLNGGSLIGTGTLTGNVTSSAIVAPGGDGTAGILTISGGYTQNSGGTLKIDVGGLATGGSVR